MFAQFNDETKTVINGIFYSEQPSDVVPFQEEIQPSDPRYKVWWNSLLPGTPTFGLESPTDE